MSTAPKLGLAYVYVPLVEGNSPIHKIQNSVQPKAIKHKHLIYNFAKTPYSVTKSVSPL